MNITEQVADRSIEADEVHIPTDCALADEDLDTVTGGAYRFVRAVAYSGIKGTETNLGTNGQLWVTSAT